ncbi:MAG: ABC transporter substrate-binding protein/permease [Eubacterium sp.]|nr:ABC transporter substrate-binding protein/permease [Eubacterium sp.]
MNRNHFYIIIVLISAAFLAALLLCGCSRNEEITSPSQLNDPLYTVGAGAGSADELRVKDVLPKAKISYMVIPDAYRAVQQGKIDAYAFDYQQMQVAIDNGVTGVRLLDETIGEEIPIAVGISPKSDIPDFTNEVNKFIDDMRNDGTLDDMYKRWIVDGDESMPDIPEPEAPKLHLTVGTTGLIRPYTYYVGTELNGYDIELAKRFAAWLNASLEFKVYDYDAVVIAAHTGDVDCVMADLNVTPEREEAMLFSQPILVNRTGLIVKDGSKSPVSDFFTDIRENFQKTFIREDRWKLFVNGVLTTLLITVLSIVFGTLLGFAVYLSCRSGNRVIDQITKTSVWLVQGLPVVVLLMILYYIVFASFRLSGTAVAVIGFTLVFGSSVYGMIRTGVGAVDIGQTEAAYSLGYTDRESFFKVVLPQAMPFIIEPYKGEVTALIKATAVVGFIAVQDLTKTGDIIRSRTYEPFFPLIAVAVIYFLLAALLKRIVERIEPAFNPKKRSREDILKEVRNK